MHGVGHERICRRELQVVLLVVAWASCVVQQSKGCICWERRLVPSKPPQQHCNTCCSESARWGEDPYDKAACRKAVFSLRLRGGQESDGDGGGRKRRKRKRKKMPDIFVRADKSPKVGVTRSDCCLLLFVPRGWYPTCSCSNNIK